MLKEKLKSMLKSSLDLGKRGFNFVKSHMTKKTVAIILSSAVILGGLVSGGVVLAKYAQDHWSDNLVDLSKFQFSSNLLKPASENATYHNATNTISFDLMNYVDDIRKSELDIVYEVSIECDGEPVQNPTGTNISGTISAASATETRVTYSNLQYGKSYVVTARSTKYYTKELSATFVIPAENDAVQVSIEKTDYVVTIIVKTDNFAGNANITWQNGYVPDNSYAPLSGATGISHSVAIGSKSTYKFKFFKSDLDAAYNESAFTFSATSN